MLNSIQKCHLTVCEQRLGCDIAKHVSFGTVGLLLICLRRFFKLIQAWWRPQEIKKWLRERRPLKRWLKIITLKSFLSDKITRIWGKEIISFTIRWSVINIYGSRTVIKWIVLLSGLQFQNNTMNPIQGTHHTGYFVTYFCNPASNYSKSIVQNRKIDIIR